LSQLISYGEKLREINAVPAKEILKNKARVCSPLSAVCEILDNIFDNFDENGSRDRLSISFAIRSHGDGAITISEDSGGICDKKLESLVRLGVAYHAAKGSIGTWGEGFKVAAFSLGAELEVVTHFPDEQPVVVHFGENWLDTLDWNVPLYSATNAPPQGSTVFIIRRLAREIDWSDLMRQIARIYGHKILILNDAHRTVQLDFEIDGTKTTIKPVPYASPEVLSMVFCHVPGFQPRRFFKRWHTQNGTVNCTLTIGLTPHNSQNTSGVYMYGNGRMFAQALRSKAVGYGDSGNSILRDHPSCWRIHAYAFFEADDGANIPWQAPLKDGVSDNHLITKEFRELLRFAVAPYARFAKIAKASELIPFTLAWNRFNDGKKAETLFGSDEPSAMRLYSKLPEEIRHFCAPTEIDQIEVDSVEGQVLVSKLEQLAKSLRQVIVRRDAGGQELEPDVLRMLCPDAFAYEKHAFPNGSGKSTPAEAKTMRLSVELESAKVKKLMSLFGAATAREAVKIAIVFAMKNARLIKSG